MASKIAQDHANKAAVYALLAGAKEAWLRARAPPRRGVGYGSRGRGRGRMLQIVAPSGSHTPSLSPIHAAPLLA